MRQNAGILVNPTTAKPTDYPMKWVIVFKSVGFAVGSLAD